MFKMIDHEIISGGCPQKQCQSHFDCINRIGEKKKKNWVAVQTADLFEHNGYSNFPPLMKSGFL